MGAERNRRLVIVSGPRGWPTDLGHRISAELIALRGNTDPADMTLIHGAAGGFDTIAAHAAAELGWTVDPIRADWAGPCDTTCKRGCRRQGAHGSYCPRAGHRRNQAMVDRRPGAAVVGLMACIADRCHRPGIHWTHGTEDCAKRILTAGIPVRWVRAADGDLAVPTITGAA